MLRDQDESDDDLIQPPDTGSGGAGGGRAVISLGSVGHDQDGPADTGTNSPNGGAIGAAPTGAADARERRNRCQARTAPGSARDRPRWMARPAPGLPPVDSVPEIEPAAVDETPVELSEATLPEELPEDTSDSAIIPYSPPDWKAVFGTLEEAAENRSDSDRGTDEGETVESADVMVLPEPDDLPYASDEPLAEARPSRMPIYTFDVDEPEEAPAESAEADLASDDDGPQHVFAEPPVCSNRRPRGARAALPGRI